MTAKPNFYQPSVWHDPSEIIVICWFSAQDFIIINVENNIFVETVLYFYFKFQDLLINNK